LLLPERQSPVLQTSQQQSWLVQYIVPAWCVMKVVWRKAGRAPGAQHHLTQRL